MNVAFTLVHRRAAFGRLRSPTRGLLLVTLVALMALGGGLGNHAPAFAQSGSLRIDPPSQTVAEGEPFTVKIIQSADVTTLSAQTNVLFNPAVSQINSVQVGPSYTDALFLYGVQSDGSAASIEAAIAAANGSGVLRNIATFFTPGAGSVPPGDTEFVTIGMTGTGAGQTALELAPLDPVPNQPPGFYFSPVEMLDEAGIKIPVSVQNGEVTVTGGGGGDAPTPTEAAASASPIASPTASPQLARVANASATLSVAAGGQQLAVGAEGKVELKVKANVKLVGAESDITFDKSIIEITKVEQGSSWKKATLVAGTGRQTIEQALADAKNKGELKAVGVQLLATGGTSASPSASPGGSSAAPATSAATTTPTPPTATSTASPSTSAPTRSPSASGQAGGAEESLLVLTVKGLKNGETELKLKNAEVLDETGSAVKVTAQNGKITVGEGGGGGGIGLPLIIGGGILGIGVIGGAGFAVRSLRRRGLGL